MISPQSEECIRSRRAGAAFGAAGFDLQGLRQCMATRREPVGTTARLERASVDGMPGEWVVAEGADPDTRLLYLHGGGYVSGSGAFYLPLAARLSAAARCAVLLPDYRLAPESPFPAALEDCVRAHAWMAAHGPSGPSPAAATFIAGDSAGGGLTLAALLLLRDRGMRQPKAGIALSPFADLTLSGASLHSEAELDPVMHPNCLPRFVELYLAGADARAPLASPAFGDYRGAPPLLIQVGEHEIIRDDSVSVAAKAKADGAAVTLEVWEGLFHVFQSQEPALPEGQEAIEHIAKFMLTANIDQTKGRR